MVDVLDVKLRLIVEEWLIIGLGLRDSHFFVLVAAGKVKLENNHWVLEAAGEVSYLDDIEHTLLDEFNVVLKGPVLLVSLLNVYCHWRRGPVNSQFLFQDVYVLVGFEDLLLLDDLALPQLSDKLQIVSSELLYIQFAIPVGIQVEDFYNKFSGFVNWHSLFDVELLHLLWRNAHV